MACRRTSKSQGPIQSKPAAEEDYTLKKLSNGQNVLCRGNYEKLLKDGGGDYRLQQRQGQMVLVDVYGKARSCASYFQDPDSNTTAGFSTTWKAPESAVAAPYGAGARSEAHISFASPRLFGGGSPNSQSSQGLRVDEDLPRSQKAAAGCSPAARTRQGRQHEARADEVTGDSWGLLSCFGAATTPFKGQPEGTKADYGVWEEATKRRVALIGDSSLDNILWIGKGQSISEQLSLYKDVAVCNLAADGFTTADVLHGSSRVISASARQYQERIRWSPKQIFRPLEQLQALQPPPTHIVLSVGGNDVRVILGNLSQLRTTLHTLQENYKKIAKQIKATCPDSSLVLMLQYRPCYVPEEDRHYRVYAAMSTLREPPRLFPPEANPLMKLNTLMELIYRDLLAELVPLLQPKIIDMPNSFNVHSTLHYSHQIEPSQAGGEIIAKLIHAAVSDRSREAKLFYNDPSQSFQGHPVPSPWTIWLDNIAPALRVNRGGHSSRAFLSPWQPRRETLGPIPAASHEL